MSRSIVFYTDGSGLGGRTSSYQEITDRNLIGWAFVALHNDEIVESYGVKTGKLIENNHEWVALVEAYLYAKSHNYLNSEISVYTDCQDFSDCAFSVVAENIRNVSREKWVRRITNFLAENYEFIDAESFIDFLITARIHKIKSHSFLVYNTRADALAKSVLRQHIDPDYPKMCSFDQWIDAKFGGKGPGLGFIFLFQNIKMIEKLLIDVKTGDNAIYLHEGRTVAGIVIVGYTPEDRSVRIRWNEGDDWHRTEKYDLTIYWLKYIHFYNTKEELLLIQMRGEYEREDI